MIDLSVVIVSYNTKDFLKNCLDSIYKTSKNFSFEIIVVDNASSDNSADLVSREYKDVILIKNSQNLGFSKANNLGVKKSTGRYVLFLNSDTLVYENTLKYMIDFMDENNKVGAATCKLVMPNEKIDDASHRGFPTPWNSFTHFSGLAKIFPKTKTFGGYNLGYMDFTTTHEIDALAGAFMLVRRNAGKDVGWWDEDYFFYGEDIDFCYELKARGWKIYYVPEVSILHYKGVAGGIKSVSEEITTATKETKIRSTKARFNAMRIFYKKHYEEKYPKIITRFIYAAIAIKERLSSV